MSTTTARRVVRAILGLGLLAVLFYYVDFHQTAALLLAANHGYLLAALLVTVVGRILMAYKWNLLLHAKGIVFPYVEVLRVYYIANFLGVFLPPTVGMDIVRAMFVKRKENSFPDIISSIFVERLLGMIVISLFAAIGCLKMITVFMMTGFPAIRLLALACLLVIGALLAIVVSFSSWFRTMIDRLLSRSFRIHLLNTCARHLRGIFESYYAYRHHRKILASFCLLTGAEVLTLIIWNYWAGLALGVDIGFINYVYFIPIITLLVRLPITFLGFGIQEGAFVFFLRLYGISNEHGLAIGVMAHMVATIALLPGGFLYAFTRRYREAYASRSNNLGEVRTGDRSIPLG